MVEGHLVLTRRWFGSCRCPNTDIYHCCCKAETGLMTGKQRWWNDGCSVRRFTSHLFCFPCPPALVVFSSTHKFSPWDSFSRHLPYVSSPYPRFLQAQALHRDRLMNIVVNACSKAGKWNIVPCHPPIHLTRLVFKDAKKEKAIINKGNGWLDSFIDG
jgi:hypothetical protein